ncbi:MAG: SIMPL domain-containing protein [Hyphomicrobiales bacterium]
MRLFPALAPALVFAILTAFAPVKAMAEEKTPKISLSAEGVVFASPDMAIITIGTVTEADDAISALEQNNKSTSAFLAALKAAGVEGKDLQTSNFSIEPQIVYPKTRNSSSSVNPKGPSIVGYTVRNSVTVRIRDLKLIGNVLNEAVTLGANSINGPRFDVEDPSALQAEARKKAMEAAIAKAQDYASAAGVTLGPILQISEQGGFQPQPEMMMMARSSMAADVVPVEAGSVSYNATVSVEWSISQ